MAVALDVRRWDSARRPKTSRSTIVIGVAGSSGRCPTSYHFSFGKSASQIIHCQSNQMESIASPPVSVAERASWLLDLSTKNREKQQSLAPPKRVANTFTSIREKVQLFEQMTQPHSSGEEPSSSQGLSEHPLLSESFSSASSTNTRTTSTSSSEEPVTPPPPPASVTPFIPRSSPILRNFKHAEDETKESTVPPSIVEEPVATVTAPSDRTNQPIEENDRVVAIVKLADSSKNPPNIVPQDRCHSPSSWDESDNFSDPWMVPSNDSVVPKETNIPSWHPNALLNIPSQSSNGTRSYVFADTDDDEDDDDIQTVRDERDVGWTTAYESRESLLLQPPFIARYEKNGHDIASLLQPDSVVDTPKEVKYTVTTGTPIDDEKDIVGRIKSQRSLIPALGRREMSLSAMRNKKQMMESSTENRDPSTDVTESWFAETFDNDEASAASALFPSSPLDLQFDASADTLNTVPSIEATTPPRSISPPMVRRFPMGSVSIPYVPSRLVTHDITSTNAYTTAFMGNVFAEEMVTCASGNTYGCDVPSIAKPSIVRPKSAFVLHPKPMTMADSGVSTSTTTHRPSIPSLDVSELETPVGSKPKSDRISSTIAQLYQQSKGGIRFQRKSLVQTRQEQLATKLAKDRVKNHTTKGLWQKDSNGNFKKHFVLVEDWKTKSVK